MRSRAAVLALVSLVLVSAVAPAVAIPDASVESGVQLSGSPATDGTTYSYQLDDISSVSDPVVNLTGVTNTEWANASVSGVSDGGTVGPVVAGNMAPLGPGGGDPLVTVTGAAHSESKSKEATSITTSDTFEYVGSYTPRFRFRDAGNGDGSTTTIDYVLINTQNGNTLHSDSVTLTDSADNVYESEQPTHTLNTSIEPGQVKVEMQSGTTEAFMTHLDVTTGPPDITVQTATTAHSFSSVSSATSARVDMGAGEQLTVSYTAGTVDAGVDLQERTQTTDAAIELNGQTESVDGTLSDGETISRTLPKEWLESGENTVNVSVGNDSLSTDAPAPAVGFSYSHNASVRVNVNATSGQWESTYRASKTFTGDRENAVLNLSTGRNVVSFKNVEVDAGNGYNSISPSEWSFDDGVLRVSLGDRSADETVSVRAVARHVDVDGGSISVTEPTRRARNLIPSSASTQCPVT